MAARLREIGPSCPWCGEPTEMAKVGPKAHAHSRLGLSFVAFCGGECCSVQQPSPRGFITEVQMAVGWTGPQCDFPFFSPFNPAPSWEMETDLDRWDDYRSYG